jgi:UDP-glucose 4-epimerase
LCLQSNLQNQRHDCLANSNARLIGEKIGIFATGSLRPEMTLSMCRASKGCTIQKTYVSHGNPVDRGLLAYTVKENGIDSCMHFAASAFVAESVEKLALYFENNVQQGISLLNALVDANVCRFRSTPSCIC